MVGRLRDIWRRVEVVTRPVHPDLEVALRRRWEELPAHVKTPAQALGRRTMGCEGTQGPSYTGPSCCRTGSCAGSIGIRNRSRRYSEGEAMHYDVVSVRPTAG